MKKLFSSVWVERAGSHTLLGCTQYLYFHSSKKANIKLEAKNKAYIDKTKQHVKEEEINGKKERIKGGNKEQNGTW